MTVAVVSGGSGVDPERLFGCSTETVEAWEGLAGLGVIHHREVEALLRWTRCVEVMREALSTLARGDAVLPLRSMM